MKRPDFTPYTPTLDAFVREALCSALKIALREAAGKECKITDSTVPSSTDSWPRPWFLSSSDSYGNDKSDFVA